MNFKRTDVKDSESSGCGVISIKTKFTVHSFRKIAFLCAFLYVLYYWDVSLLGILSHLLGVL